MGRRVRHEHPLDWHVFNRGSRRMALFRDDQDARVFMALFATALDRSGCTLWAYVLMTNHFHAAMRGNSDQLQRCMHDLEGFYAHYHNKRYSLSGAAFEGRYEAFPQGTLPLLYRTTAYVLMNPVAAHMVSTPGEYSWSNYAAFFGERPWLLEGEAELLLERLDPDPSVAQSYLKSFMDRERVRIEKGLHRPGLSARDVQANHFDWLLEEAQKRKDVIARFSPMTLAVLWAKDAGFHRGAIAKVLGGPMSPSLRHELADLREWLLEKSDNALAAALP